jgi:predicted membrane protein
VLPATALSYDMLVHVFFIGYAFSMIFAHGPIILPGELGITLRPYHPVVYAWLLLVQGSLLFLVCSDAVSNLEGRKVSGYFLGVGVVFYFVRLVVLVVRGRRVSDLGAANRFSP